MKYRIICDLTFKSKVDADAFWLAVATHGSKSVILNPGKPNQESFTGNYQKCYHDEKQPKPCQTLDTLPNSPKALKEGVVSW